MIRKWKFNALKYGGFLAMDLSNLNEPDYSQRLELKDGSVVLAEFDKNNRLLSVELVAAVNHVEKNV